MRIPFVLAPHGGDASPGLRGVLFEGEGILLGQRRGDRRPLPGAAQQGQYPVAVMREVRVQADPAPIAAFVDSRDVVPTGRRLGAVQGDVAFGVELQHGVPAFDAGPLRRPATAAVDLGRRERRRADAGLGGIRNAEGGGKDRPLAG